MQVAKFLVSFYIIVVLQKVTRTDRLKDRDDHYNRYDIIHHDSVDGLFVIDEAKELCRFR